MNMELYKQGDDLFENAARPLSRVTGSLQSSMDAAIDELSRLKPGHYLIPLLAEWKGQMLAELERAQEQIRVTQDIVRKG